MGDQGRIVTEEAEAEGGVRSKFGERFRGAWLGERWSGGFGKFMNLELDR